MSELSETFKQQFRARLGRPLQSLGFAIGLTEFSPRLRRVHGAIILMYHSVADTEHARWIDPQNHVPIDVFESQMAYLAQNRHVISLADLVQLIRDGRSADPRSVVITFDDGYRDNLTVAAPLLGRYDFPATLFLPTAYIDLAQPQWIDEAYSAFAFRTHNELALGKGNDQVCNLKDAATCELAYRRLCDALFIADMTERKTLLRHLREQLQPSETPDGVTMSWDDVRHLCDQYPQFDIGGHTVGHTDMTSISRDLAQHEMVECARRIEEEIGRRPQFFSFPYGRTDDELRALATACGYKAACGSTGDKLVTAATYNMALPRVVAPRTMHRFGLMTSAANSGIWRKLGR